MHSRSDFETYELYVSVPLLSLCVLFFLSFTRFSIIVVRPLSRFLSSLCASCFSFISSVLVSLWSGPSLGSSHLFVRLVFPFFQAF